MLPSLTKFAQSGVTPHRLLAAMDNENAAARRTVPDRIQDANRWLLAALARLNSDASADGLRPHID